MNNAFLRGTPILLGIPQCVRREWAANGVVGPRLLEIEQQHEGELGYEFAWGQVVECLVDADDVDVGGDEGDVVLWSFRLNQLHEEFIDAGGNLGELADAALCLMEDVSGDNGWPEFLCVEEGDDLSSFNIEVCGTQNLLAARRWINDDFIPEWLPSLFAEIRALNKIAAKDVSNNVESLAHQSPGLQDRGRNQS